jgi:hypothetical protein
MIYKGHSYSIATTWKTPKLFEKKKCEQRSSHTFWVKPIKDQSTLMNVFGGILIWWLSHSRVNPIKVICPKPMTWNCDFNCNENNVIWTVLWQWRFKFEFNFFGLKIILLAMIPFLGHVEW